MLNFRLIGLHEIEDWEYEDPNQINEVPEKTTNLNTVS